MDRQPVVEGKTRVTVAEVGGGCVLLQLSSECRERADEVLQESENLISREQVFHHHKADQVQAEVPADRSWIYGGTQPARVGRPAGLGWLIHAAAPG